MRRLKRDIIHLSCAAPLFLWLSLFCLCIPSFVFALEPHEVLVIANKSASDSVSLAKYYMKKRGIPKKNLVKLRITDKTWCSRKEYDEEVVPSILKYLKKNDPDKKIRCLLTMYGVPLKIHPPEMTSDEKKQLKKLKKKREFLKTELHALAKDQVKEKGILKQNLQDLGKQIAVVIKHDYRVSFDSELALVLAADYPLKSWIPNPYYLGFKNQKVKIPKEKVFMVSRLDASNDKIVKRIIDDSIEVEKTGLRGTAYFDAKRPRPDEKKQIKSATVLYDNSLYLAADRVEKSQRMPVVVNSEMKLFQPGDCPDAALYGGWYSLNKYIDAFEWQPGAVGYHMVSSTVWWRAIIEDGAAASLGPVSEPYLQAYPLPEMFFGLLIDGYYTLVESYILSLPYLSWQMVLVGDPLYRPFKNSNRLH